MKDVLTAMVKAHEIQGVLALENSFNRVGLDHVVLVKVASTAVVAQMLGCSYEQVVNAVSQAWVDGQSLRTYRHAPNTGSRKSWAAGDATSRAVRLALISKTGEMGYPSVLTRQGLGLLRRPVQGQAVQVPAQVRQLRDGERAVQDLLPRRVPLADRGGMRDDDLPGDEAARQDGRRHQEREDPHPRGGDPHHRQEGPAEQSGRPRSLHPVHGGRAAPLRPPDGGRLRGRRREGSADR